MSDPLSRTVRNVCDIVGSTISACATSAAKNARRVEQQVRTSHMLGRFMVTGAEQFIRTKFSPPASSPNTASPNTASPNTASPNTASPNSEVSENVPQSSLVEEQDVEEQDVEEQDVEEQDVEEQPPKTVPLDDYDLLTSVQVVELLATMSPDERQSVWEYENTHRRRRTILESSRSSDGS